MYALRKKNKNRTMSHVSILMVPFNGIVPCQAKTGLTSWTRLDCVELWEIYINKSCLTRKDSDKPVK